MDSLSNSPAANSEAAYRDEVTNRRDHGAEYAAAPDIPLFSYNLAKPTHRSYGWIVKRDQLFHRISDPDAFYVALGYRATGEHSGMLPDEFVWERYSRAPNPKPANCFQTQLAVYLNTHSEKFRSLYGGAYAALVGKCAATYIADADADAQCLYCPKQPRFSSQSIAP